MPLWLVIMRSVKGSTTLPVKQGSHHVLHIITIALNHDKLNKTCYGTKQEYTLLGPFCFRPLQAAIRQYQIQVLNYNVNRRCGLQSNRLDYRQSDKYKQETKLNLNHAQEYLSTILLLIYKSSCLQLWVGFLTALALLYLISLFLYMSDVYCTITHSSSPVVLNQPAVIDGGNVRYKFKYN